jgi:PAS domain S-box-containing protein
MVAPGGPARLSEFQLLNIVDSMSDAFVFVDEQWRYLYVNPQAEKFMGRRADSVLGRHMWDEFGYMVDTSVYRELQRAMERREATRFEFYYADRDQWLEHEAYPLQPGLLVLFRDISDRKRTEATISRQATELQQREDVAVKRLAELETIYAKAPIGLCVLDTDLRFSRINDRLADMNGMPAASHIGRTVREMVPHLADQVEPLLRKVLETGEPVVALEITGETLACPGEPHTFRDSFFPIRTPGGEIIGINIVAEGVTEEVRAQQTKARLTQQLRSLATELSLAEDRERKRLATAIHDNLAQLLAVSLMRLEAIERAKEIETQRPALKQVTAILDEALTAARTLTADLRPPLHGYGNDVRDALNWVAEKMRRHGLMVSFNVSGNPEGLADDVLIVTYQAVQELLWNVIKHAQTSEATIALNRSGHHVEIVVEDHGRGFDAAHRTQREGGGFGLFSIRERLSLVGGQLDVTPVSPHGTRARITVPVQSDIHDVRDVMGQPLEGLPDVAQPPQ